MRRQTSQFAETHQERAAVNAAAGTSVNSNRDSERVFAQNGRTDGEMDREVALSCDGIFALSREKREKIERSIG